MPPVTQERFSVINYKGVWGKRPLHNFRFWPGLFLEWLSKTAVNLIHNRRTPDQYLRQEHTFHSTAVFDEGVHTQPHTMQRRSELCAKSRWETCQETKAYALFVRPAFHLSLWTSVGREMQTARLHAVSLNAVCNCSIRAVAFRPADNSRLPGMPTRERRAESWGS